MLREVPSQKILLIAYQSLIGFKEKIDIDHPKMCGTGLIIRIVHSCLVVMCWEDFMIKSIVSNSEGLQESKIFTVFCYFLREAKELMEEFLQMYPYIELSEMIFGLTLFRLAKINFELSQFMIPIAADCYARYKFFTECLRIYNLRYQLDELLAELITLEDPNFKAALPISI
jgi:hypothetical protein